MTNLIILFYIQSTSPEVELKTAAVFVGFNNVPHEIMSTVDFFIV